MLKVRNILLTINQIEKFDNIRDYLINLKYFQYCIAGLEKAPTTGHEHIHFYVQYNQGQKISKAKLLNQRLDICRGTAKQNIEYCSKDGNIIYEKGEPLHKGGKTIEDVIKMDPQERKQLPIAYYNIINKINTEESKNISVEDFHKEVEVYYLWGPSGSGKTKKAIEILKGHGIKTFNLVKYDGTFWHGTTENGGAALYDDWRDSHMKPSEFINFIDYNKQIMNIKGGTMKNNYNFIIITSVQDPEKIYSNIEGEPRKQWLRRIKEIQKFEYL